MITLAGELGRILFGVAAAELFRGMLSQSGRTGLIGAEPPSTNTFKIGANIMSGYDLVGDDDYGSIGEDFIGEDADLMEALAISGMDDEIISGAGDTEIVGAASRRGGRSARRTAELRRLIQKNAGAVINRGLDRRRRYPLGFIPTPIPAGTSLAIPSAPQNLFRPERLVIPSDIAFDLGIRDIKVGNQSQLVQSAEVPAALFSEVAINTGVTFDTAEVGNQVSVDMRNKSAADLEFSAGLVGTIAK